MKRKNLLLFPLVAATCTMLLGGCGSSAPSQVSENAQTAIEAVESIADAAPETANESTDEKKEETTSDSSETAASTDAPAETAAEETAPATVIGITERSDEMRDITPTELVSEIKAGWNLGNTFDAFGKSGVEAETSWGNPKTTKEMIDAVCEKGFNAIRIPVTYADHMGPAPDYTVEPEWFDRVEEVINYALDDGMYVIINTHHEEAWRIPDDAHIDAVDAQNKALWTQIAERFKDYGDHLIFEGLNEPRVKGGEKEWEGGTAEGRACLDRLNQTFVDAVRATGGNNEKRLLLITTFASSHVNVTISTLKIPEDEHIAVSIHAYTPYVFTYVNDQSSATDVWDGSLTKDITGVMTDLWRVFLSKDIPVLLTEYGAEDKNKNTEEVRKWVVDYVSKATTRGIPCFWWDNGIYDQSGEKFAIFDRKNLSWYREEVVDAIIEESYKEKQ